MKKSSDTSAQPPFPVVLLHGMGSGADVWSEVTPHLPKHEVHALPLAGHVGGAQLVGDARTIVGMVDDIERQLDARGIAQAHLVGNSIGGWMALVLAERGRAASVMCLAPAGGWRPNGWFELCLVLRFAIGHIALRLVARAVPRLANSPRARRLILGPTVAHPERVTAAQTTAILRNLAACTLVLAICRQVRDRGFRRLPTVDVPVLIVWSGADRVLKPSQARARFGNLGPTATEHELAGVGHVPMLDDPRLVAAVIEDHVRSVEQDLGLTGRHGLHTRPSQR